MTKMNNEKECEEIRAELESLRSKLIDYEEIKLEFELLQAALTIPEAYYGIVSEKTALELELLKSKLRDATEIIRSLEYSSVYDWGDEYSPPDSCCPFCAANEREKHKNDCSIGNFFL